MPKLRDEIYGNVPPEVMINGVLYVPAVTAAPALEDIARALAEIFWGDTKGKPLEEVLDGLTVEVTDSGEGDPIQEVIAALARRLASPTSESQDA